MQLERRRMVRRAFTGGVLLATTAMVPLALLEVVYALAVRRPSLDSAGQGALFTLQVSLLLLSAGALLGLAEGFVTLGVSLLTKALAKKRVAEPRWMAWIYSFLALPGIAMVAARVFSGRQASQIPGKHFIALGLGLAGLLGAYALFRLIISLREHFRMRRWGRRQALILAPALLLAAGLLYWADHAVLPRLYTWFHLALSVLVVVLLQLGVGTLYVGYRARTRWLGKVMEPSVSMLLLVAATAVGAWSLASIGASQPMRYLVHEHTVASARVMAGATALGLASPARPATPEAPAPGPARPPAAPAPLMAGPLAPDRSVLLITVDAMRADQLKVHGQARSVTPNLDRWAAGAAVFKRGYCQVPHTSFSVASLMTGTYLHAEHRASPSRHHGTLPEALRRYGYKTAAFFPPAVFYIDRQAFTRFERARFGFEYVKYQYISAEGRVDQAIDFLNRQRGKKVLVWVHFFEPHEPYVKHPGFDLGAGAMDRYQSEVAYVDHHVGRLIAHMQREQPGAIIALTADHGEEFGEHGGHYHGNALYEPQVRVPLAVSGPGVKPRVVAGPAQVIDLAPTLLSLLDLPVPAAMRGTDLGPWLAGQSPAALPAAFVEIDRKKAIIRGRHKLICDLAGQFCELYDLDRDPGERHNLAGKEQARAARLRKELDAWIASHVPRRGEESDDSEALALLERGAQGDATTVPGLARLAEARGELGRRAVGVLARMGAPAARVALARAARSKDPGVAIPACIGAATLGDAESLSALPGHLSRPDLPPGLRLDALLAQARAGLRSATTELTRLLAASDDLYQRLEIIKALGRLGDPAAADALLPHLGKLRTRLYTMEALGKVGARQAVPELGRALTRDRFISWRRAAARALGQIGDPRATPALRRAVAQDLERLVVADAVAALARMDSLPAPSTVAVPVAASGWSCQDGRCTLRLGGPDTCRRGAGKELLIARAGGPARAHAEPVREAVIKAPAAGAEGRLTVHCGEEKVSSADLLPAGAAVVPIPAGAAGPLSLTSPAPPPAIVQAALRKVPAAAPKFK